ncbi:metal-dependent hydrolase [Kistimonas asteriae]|uniref:metal-dependent hydrolase n=1 Tax=Kistimonas asteriae TaxID=517724 RepID=UPI001BA6EE10|nr:metal-dependent hydrolase [Kistimonas asteriae]
MDSVTQALLGAAVGGAVAGRRYGRKAFLWGAVLGTLPDLDNLIRWGDAISDMTKHRGFSHSLFFLTPFSLVLTAAVYRCFSSLRPGFLPLWLMIWLCLITHPVLDAFTTYGTQLFWPMPLQPVALSSVFIIDPLYTLPLLIGVLLCLRKWGTNNAWRWNTAGLMVSTGYLMLSLLAKSVVHERLETTLAAGDLSYKPVFSAPTPFNIVLWRVMVLDGDQYHEGLASLLDDQANIQLIKFPGKSVADAPELASLDRLNWFTGGFYSLHETQGDLIATDLRLGVYAIHPFRFLVAERDANGLWQPVNPELKGSLVPQSLSGFPRLWERMQGNTLDVCEVSVGSPCDTDFP